MADFTVLKDHLGMRSEAALDAVAPRWVMANGVTMVAVGAEALSAACGHVYPRDNMAFPDGPNSTPLVRRTVQGREFKPLLHAGLSPDPH